MNNSRVEESLNKIPLVVKTIKYNFLKNRNIKAINVKYGKNIKQYYELYNPKYNNKPIIFFIHGGGWWHGSPKMCSYIGKYFARNGYTVIMPAYRLSPVYKYPNQIEDVYEALNNYIKKNKYWKGREIIVMGFSAGAELAANVVFNKSFQKKYKIKQSVFVGLVTYAGVLNFQKCISKHSRILIRNYLGDDISIANSNPINLINKNINIPVLCIHGDKDYLINKENSTSFIERVNSFKNIGKVEIIRGMHHSDINELIMGKGKCKSKLIIEFLKDIEKGYKLK